MHKLAKDQMSWRMAVRGFCDEGKPVVMSSDWSGLCCLEGAQPLRLELTGRKYAANILLFVKNMNILV